MPAVELPYNYTPRWFQVPIFQHFIPNPTRKRAMIVAHRRYGKDLLCVNLAACLTQQRVGTYWHVLPFAKQARAIVWNGMDMPSEEEEKAGKVARRFRDYFHPDTISHTNENEMRIHFKNGSVWQAIGGDDIDKHVGTNPIGVVLSEYALIDPRVYDYIRPILRQNRGWAIMITTIRGKNHAWKLLKRAESLQATDPNWLAINHDVKYTGSFTEEDIEAERKEGMSEALIRQEYYNDPSAPIEGAYYANELARAEKEGRITTVPYDPKLPVHTAWDLGFGDATVIVFYQTIGAEIRVIDCYANSGEEMAHYASVLKQKDYGYDSHHAPWDVEIKHLASGGKSIWDVAKGLGIRFKVAPQPRIVADGIEQVRNVFPRVWIDKEKCARLLEALAGYRKEPLPEKYQNGSDDQKVYKDTPLHSWESHYADAFRVMAWSIKKSAGFTKEIKQHRAEDDFVYF